MRKSSTAASEEIKDVVFRTNGVLLELSSVSYLISKEDYLDGYYYPRKSLTASEKKTLEFKAKNKKASDYLIRILSSSRYSVFQVSEKLKAKFALSEKDISSLLSPYIENHILDDEKYAEEYLSMKLEQGFGRRALISALKEKGISDDILEKEEIQSLLLEDKSYIEETAIRYDKKKKNCTIEKRKSSLRDHLLRRGYPLELIVPILEALFSNLSEEEKQHDYEIQTKELKEKGRKCYNAIARKDISDKDKRSQWIQKLLSYGFRYADIQELLSVERYFQND